MQGCILYCVLGMVFQVYHQIIPLELMDGEITEQCVITMLSLKY